MTAMAENRARQSIPDPKRRVGAWTIYAAEIMYYVGIAGRDYAGEVQMAADTAGLVVEGYTNEYVDNTDDGETITLEMGVRLWNNSSTSPITRSLIGQPCFVEDDNTVAGKTTNYVAAGLVYDVTSDGVFVDMSPTALALARALAPSVLTAKTADYTIPSALAFAGNQIFSGSKNGGMTFTLPSAVAGMRVGIFRLTDTAGYDVAIQAATGDKILGSNAAKKVDNAVDARSQILWIKALDATDWVVDNPYPSDIASWVVNNT